MKETGNRKQESHVCFSFEKQQDNDDGTYDLTGRPMMARTVRFSSGHEAKWRGLLFPHLLHTLGELGSSAQCSSGASGTLTLLLATALVFDMLEDDDEGG